MVKAANVNISRRFKNPVLLISLVIITLLAACGAPDTPQDVAEKFWRSISKKNYQQAENLSLNNTLSPALRDFAITDFKIETIRIKGQQAKIDTLIWLKGPNQAKQIQLITHLTMENHQWRVDTEKTHDSRLPGALHSLFKSLEEVKDGFIESLNESTKDMEKQMPEVEDKLQSLGKDLINEFGDIMDEVLPKIQSAVEQGLDELDDALQEFEQQKPSETSLPHPEGKAI